MTARKQRKPRTRKERNEQTAKDYFLELCSAYYDDLKSTGNNALHGQFLNNVEAVVLDQGQELLRQSLEIITQEQVDEIEKKRDPRMSKMPREKTASRQSHEKERNLRRNHRSFKTLR